jgi:hypothetical protein
VLSTERPYHYRSCMYLERGQLLSSLEARFGHDSQSRIWNMCIRFRAADHRRGSLTSLLGWGERTIVLSLPLCSNKTIEPGIGSSEDMVTGFVVSGRVRIGMFLPSVGYSGYNARGMSYEPGQRRKREGEDGHGHLRGGLLIYKGHIRGS